ncbi:SAM-dependent methyltransferase [Methylobacillus gramineus]|uniref:class I SAM-dependent methyltransferase n=1 Tax=Methylobacillus gramineus TaxID=755169 RepID=UPI001D000CF9|nr:SAM-dependent methyltransferase [Methylobacillus gramineus]MCB5185612.1 SAM-dependent methyltransferase [Methylobacillus gramineus]
MDITSLPVPEQDALAHSQELSEYIRHQIHAAGGWLDFASYMNLVLYSPGLGYYSGGAKKFGAAGDFVTAPEISPLFAQTLAQQVIQILKETEGAILELGAGSGRLAAALLQELADAKTLPAQYLILEVSAHLREVQKQYLGMVLPKAIFQCVQWLDALPEHFTGVVLGNEVLDALPVNLVQHMDGELQELGVAASAEHGLHFASHPLVAGRVRDLVESLALPEGYQTEVCPAATALIGSLSLMLQRGVLLFIDYGFSRAEYYHPQRNQGTLMCHYRHYAHQDPFLYPGLQDVTAHVDFTLIAEAAIANGLKLHGYCGQAQFLINCGITQILMRVSPEDVVRYVPLAGQAQKLMSPAEMGELFKVIALGKGMGGSLLGFTQGNRAHTL